jgi:hypothetical protein
MLTQTQQVTEAVTSPTPAFTVTGGLAAANYFGMALPDIVQILGAVYALLLVVHKMWQMYVEFKDRRKKDEQE